MTLWYLQTFGHCVVSPLIYEASNDPFGIFLAIVLLVLFTASNDLSSNFWPSPNDPFGIFKLLAIVLLVL